MLTMSVLCAQAKDSIGKHPKSNKLLDTISKLSKPFKTEELKPKPDELDMEDTLLVKSLADQIDTTSVYDTQQGYQISGITLFSKPHFDGHKDKRLYYYMKWRTERIFPFYLQAIDFFDKVEQQKKVLTEDQLDVYLDRVEDYLFQNFTDTVMNMTKIEGQIFSKLIYRYTGISLYDIIDSNIGMISALWWSGVATVFSIDIDQEYCPTSIKKDLWIEHILIELLDENRIDFIPKAKGYCIETKRKKIEDEQVKQDTTFKWYQPWNW